MNSAYAHISVLPYVVVGVRLEVVALPRDCRVKLTPKPDEDDGARMTTMVKHATGTGTGTAACSVFYKIIAPRL